MHESYHVRDYATNTNVMQAPAPITFVNTPKRDWTTLATRLKWAREQRKLSQTQLAAAAGVAQGTIGNLESGERKSARKLASIAAALQVNPLWLEQNKGEWEAIKGAVFHALIPEEQELLDQWRHLLPSDRRAKLKEITSLAQVRKEDREDMLAQAGLDRIAQAAAHATKTRHATTVPARRRHADEPAIEAPAHPHEK